MCRACEIEEEIGNCRQHNQNLKPWLFDTIMLQKHYDKVHGSKSRLSLVDLNEEKMKNLQHLHHAQRVQRQEKERVKQAAGRKQQDTRMGQDRQTVCYPCGVSSCHTDLMN